MTICRAVTAIILVNGVKGPNSNPAECLSQVLRGTFRYAIGDHGGIIVAVQHYRTAGEIDTLYYSTDDGESWKTFKFSNEVRMTTQSSPT